MLVGPLCLARECIFGYVILGVDLEISIADFTCFSLPNTPRLMFVKKEKPMLKDSSASVLVR